MSVGLNGHPVRIQVPATSANLGPGYDTFGLALDLFDELEIKPVPRAEAQVQVSGMGASELPTGESHLVVRAIRAALDAVGAPQSGLEIICHNRIPHGRGLGSSAAAVVAGIAAARMMLTQPEALDQTLALRLAEQFEGHLDNAAPALLGGITLNYQHAGAPQVHRLVPHTDIGLRVFVPEFQVSTISARAALPEAVPMDRVVHNIARSGLLVSALTTEPRLLFAATEDRVHQDYRSEVLAASYGLMQQLRAFGVPAVISGAGPTVLAFTTPEISPKLDHFVLPQDWNSFEYQIIQQGVRAALLK